MKKTAVTLIELLIVIVIIGILAAIAVPIYTGKIERTKGERAIANIELIVYAYKQKYLNTGMMPTPGDLPHINEDLNLDLSDSEFNYSITNQTEYYRIQATRKSGGQTIMYSLDPVDNAPDDWDTTNSTWLWMP